MRIGTWNLDARWTDGHAATLASADCDVWLLTEVPDRVALPGFGTHLTTARMVRGQHYAAVVSRLAMKPQRDPHPASALVRIADLSVCSSVLPWAAKDDPAVWGHGDQGERTTRAVHAVAAGLTPGDSIWGGDFNHALAGPVRWSGSMVGRAAIRDLLETLDMVAATAGLPHRRPGIRTIDHVAVPQAWTIADATRIEVPPALSDHDAYVVTGNVTGVRGTGSSRGQGAIAPPAAPNRA